MGNIVNRVAAVAVGVAAMYYLDPQMGRRRRALLREKMESWRHDAGGYTLAKGKRAADRFRGAMAETRSGLGLGHGLASDRQLAERVRSEMGRLVSRSGAVHVDVDNGLVRLSGHILADEREPLVSTLAAMQGVRGVEDRLSVHAAPGNVPELQGAGPN